MCLKSFKLYKKKRKPNCFGTKEQVLPKSLKTFRIKMIKQRLPCMGSVPNAVRVAEVPSVLTPPPQSKYHHPFIAQGETVALRSEAVFPWSHSL